MDSLSERVELNHGGAMPWLGFGTFRLAEGVEVESAVATALSCGYRSIDTASIYQNETGVGRAVQTSRIPREEIFITTKLWNRDHGRDAARAALSGSLTRLGLAWVDLYLIHWPVRGPRLVETWLALEEMQAEGRVRAIGVSNFTIRDLELVMRSGKVVPAVNQVEYHPFLQQRELHEFCRQHGIRLVAWAPLVRGDSLTHPVIAEIAIRHGRTAAQVLLCWALQHEVVVIPKSTRPERIRENAGVVGWSLNEADMARLDALEAGRRIGPDPENFNF